MENKKACLTLINKFKQNGQQMAQRYIKCHIPAIIKMHIEE